jgi:putative peptidoglycan lipid II flippase
MIPATAGLIVLGGHIVTVLFQRGEFTPYSTLITNSALFYYAFGLFSYGGIKILVFSFYSMQDTITPVKTASAALVVNVVLNLILMWPLKVGGLALATSIAGIFNFAVLFYILRKRIGDFGIRYIAAFVLKVIASSAVMAVSLYFIARYFGGSLPGMALLPKVTYLFGAISTGIIIYLVSLYILRVKELGRFAKWVLRTQ